MSWLKSLFIKKIDTELVDYSLLGVMILIVLLGIVMVASSSLTISEFLYGNPFLILLKQLLFFMVGCGIFFLVSTLKVEFFQINGWFFLFISFFLLLLVLMIGHEINGSIRWISLPFFNIQPSELSKFFVVIYLAVYLEKYKHQLSDQWFSVIKPMIVLGLVAFLLLLEPDFGTLVILVGTTLGMIFLAGAQLLPFVIIFIGVTIAFVLLVILEPYRLARLTAYLDPWSHAFSSGYQLTQSLIAFGRGSFLGRGLGEGIQKLFYLPEAHTDFIFAVIAEELGLVGGIILLFMYSVVIFKILKIGRLCEKQQFFFHGYCCYGIGLIILGQVFINMGVCTGLLPTKGLALPFISYGGSSMLVNSMMMGLVFRIDYERRYYVLNKAN